MSTYVAVFALALAYAALVAAYFALRTLAKLRRSSAVLGRGLRGERMRESLVEAVNRQAELTAVTREELVELRAAVATAREEAQAAVTAAASAAKAPAPGADAVGALRNVALVRYDAFDGMSGRLSFSLALLDEAGDGVTISALAGHSDTRVYAKGVADGKPAEAKLSPEEQQAVTAALAKRRGLLARKAG